MKKINYYLLAALTALCISNTPQIAAASTEDAAVIYVTGYAEKDAIPDTAVVSLGTETCATELELARKENALVMNKLNSSLATLGIAKEELKTTDYRVIPRYDKTGEKIVGYMVANHLQVRVRNLDLLPRLFQQAEVCGVNKIDDVEFSCSNASIIKAELIKAAIANGSLVAKSAASAAGVQLGRIKEIHINGRYPSLRMVKAENLGLMKANVADTMPRFEQGAQRLSESVEMVFYLE